ncbi:MAG: hypothetical protein U0457_00610 [Candidatus Sericytochromatia bacterium]
MEISGRMLAGTALTLGAMAVTAPVSVPLAAAVGAVGLFASAAHALGAGMKQGRTPEGK